jgi:hypothetical protein
VKNKMKLKMIGSVLMILALVLVAGCATSNTQTQNNTNGNPDEQLACTEEAMECPDGSFVGRNPANNCAFDACPEAMILCTGDVQQCSDGSWVGRDANNNCEFKTCSDGETLKNPTVRNYAGDSREVCAATTFLCEEGSDPFFDDSGCGCEVKEPRNYISNDTEQCSLMRYMCVQGRVPFQNEFGCGCEWTWNQPETENEGKLQATDCTDPRPEACTKEYMPVCGQVQVECIRAPCYPVKQTFGNKCEACANDRTISYTQGACEDFNTDGSENNGGAAGTVPAGTSSEQCESIGGTWTGYDCEGIGQQQCQEIGGTFNECASACRNNPDAEVCTMQCVQVCTLE